MKRGIDGATQESTQPTRTTFPETATLGPPSRQSSCSCSIFSVASQHSSLHLNSRIYSSYSQFYSSMWPSQVDLSTISQTGSDITHTEKKWKPVWIRDRTLANCLCQPNDNEKSTSSFELDLEGNRTRKCIDVKPPPKVGCRLYRWLRWNIGRVYIRLIYIVLLVNLAYLTHVALSLRNYTHKRLMNTASRAAGVNIATAILVRNKLVINGLFSLANFLGALGPLRLRRVLAKVYTYGGVHNGCGVAGTIWYLLLTGVLVWRAGFNPDFTIPACLGGVSFCLLGAICISSLPPLRTRYHNLFERIHRFVGWTVLSIFWVQTIYICNIESKQASRLIGQEVLVNPVFWMVVVSTLSIIYPWLTSRRVSVIRHEKLGSHAVRLYFNRQVSSCMAVRISDNLLLESHCFASIPEPDGKKEFSVMVSVVGDWTRKVFQTTPTKLWMRGDTTWGVLRNAIMFSPVVIVATGSGIGPCLGLLNEYKTLRCRILWSARSPEDTYGKGVIECVFRADPQALIIDTCTSGRLDMVAETFRLYHESSAEAVFCISNSDLTMKIVRDLETRGIPAFGPIWDS